MGNVLGYTISSLKVESLVEVTDFYLEVFLFLYRAYERYGYKNEKEHRYRWVIIQT